MSRPTKRTYQQLYSIAFLLYLAHLLVADNFQTDARTTDTENDQWRQTNSGKRAALFRLLLLLPPCKLTFHLSFDFFSPSHGSTLARLSSKAVHDTSVTQLATMAFGFVLPPEFVHGRFFVRGRIVIKSSSLFLVQRGGGGCTPHDDHHRQPRVAIKTDDPLRQYSRVSVLSLILASSPNPQNGANFNLPLAKRAAFCVRTSPTPTKILLPRWRGTFVETCYKIVPNECWSVHPSSSWG